MRVVRTGSHRRRDGGKQGRTGAVPVQRLRRDGRLWASVELAARGAAGSFAVALIWVLHPLNSEAVDYLTQRTESMMALFYLLTLYASVRALTESVLSIAPDYAVMLARAG